MISGEVEPGLELLADARSTDDLIRELQAAADEGMDVVASSPFRVRHRGQMRQMSELVDPLDRALRSTRVLVRQTAVAAYHRRSVPTSYAVLCKELAEAAEGRGRAGRQPDGPRQARPLLRSATRPVASSGPRCSRPR